MKKSIFWSKEISNQICDYINKNLEKYISESLLSEYNDINDNFLQADRIYKKNHNEKKYRFMRCVVIPISYLTIIPFYWAYKKYLSMRKNRISLEKNLEEVGKIKLDVHKKILNMIDFQKIENDILEKIIKFKEMGPITNNLIDEIKELKAFEFEGENTNPYCTSWSIFDDNKIVINHTRQIITSYAKKYFGSVKKKDSDNSVSASFYYPVYEIKHENTYYTLMESCSSLRFKFNKKRNLKFKKDDYQKADFENLKFNDLVEWDYNNETQMRMVFTPLAQENYVKEIENLNQTNDEDIPKKYQFCKDKSFFYNLDDIDKSEILYNKINNIKYIFSSNYYTDINSLKENISKAINESIYSKFESLIYLWMIPIFKSEDHSSIIKKNMKLSKMNKGVSNPLVSYYLFNKVSKYNINGVSTQYFNKLIKTNNHKVLKEEIFESKFIVKTFSPTPKVTYVRKEEYNIPIEYIDYIPLEDNANIIYSFVGEVNDINEILLEYPDIKYANGFICKTSKNSHSKEQLLEFSKIIKKIKKQLK